MLKFYKTLPSINFADREWYISASPIVINSNGEFNLIDYDFEHIGLYEIELIVGLKDYP